MKHEVSFCIKKIEEAIANYDIVVMKDYVNLLKLWLEKSK